MARLGLVLILWLFAAPPARAMEHVVMRQEGEEVSVSGQLVVTAEDGGMLLLSADGTLWTAEPENVVRHKHDDEPMVPFSPQQLGERLKREFPGFDIHTTQHYVICHNTSRTYAQWCGALFERLYKAFTNFWSRKDFELHEPEFPLVALVFADADSYTAYARKELKELGDSAKAIIGYYNFASNRMIMYDLTGIQALRRRGDRRSNPNEINQMLARPEAERTVATVIHEATHQIAFNCGLQTRYADVPRWLSEGIAMYFETPDLTSSKGWRSIGEVNQVRLSEFRQSLRKGRPADSLATLLATNDRLQSQPEAYAEAWALNFFLLRQKPKQYLAYIKLMAEKKPLIWDEPDDRLREFKLLFGDPDRLDAEFVKQMAKTR